MKVKDLGEFGLIKRLTEKVSRQRQVPDRDIAGFELLVDVGDDAAAWRYGDVTELATTDTVVDGVHFTRETTPWYDLGWKVMAANVSDIAAMGGVPTYALITLGLPPDTEVEDLDRLYDGMLCQGNAHGVAIVGGDIVRSPVAFVTVSLNGALRGKPMLRSAARPGDLLAVTGHMGSSAGGLEVMLSNLAVEIDAATYLKNAHRRPMPCVAQGRTLQQAGVRCAMDVSDGLVDDLSKLCQASGVAARLESNKIPIHPLLKEAFPSKHLKLALGGGEDYQLIFTAPEMLMGRVIPLLPPPAAVIGRIVKGVPGQVTVLDAAGKALPTSHGGWDHFR